MTEREFRSWQQFYREHPFTDAHRYHRPAALVAQALAGGDMAPRLAWLNGAVVNQAPPNVEASRFSEADLATMAALGMKLES